MRVGKYLIEQFIYNELIGACSRGMGVAFDNQRE